MKPTTLTSRPLVLILAILAITIALVSWDFKPAPGRYGQANNDTVPKTKSTDHPKKVRDLDEALEELNKVDFSLEMENAQKAIHESMSHFDHDKLKADIENAIKQIDFDKIQKDVNQAMTNINWEKMQQDIDMSMKKVDWEKLQKEIDGSMAKVNWEDIRNEVNQAISKMDWEKMKKEIDGSMAKVNWEDIRNDVNQAMSKMDWEKMKKDLEEVKNFKLDKLDLDMQKVQDELKNLGPTMEKARAEIEKAKVEVKEYRDFVNDLEKDGLINKKEDYSIRHKDGQLLINGKAVSPEVYSKYRSFLEKHKTFRISKNDDDFDMNMD